MRKGESKLHQVSFRCYLAAAGFKAWYFASESLAVGLSFGSKEMCEQ